MTVTRSTCRAGAWIAAFGALALMLLSGPLGHLVPAAAVGLDVSDVGGLPAGGPARLPSCGAATPTPPGGTVSLTIPALPGVNCTAAAPGARPAGQSDDHP